MTKEKLEEYLSTLDTIERCDLHGSDANTGILGEVPLKVLFVNSRA